MDDESDAQEEREGQTESCRPTVAADEIIDELVVDEPAADILCTQSSSGWIAGFCL